MQVSELQEFILGLFDRSKLSNFQDEWAFISSGNNDISRIAYSTNLTPEVVEQAIAARADFLLTHHDAWDFLYGMKERCTEMLQQHGISHAFFHLPLDDADFGTSATLAARLGLSIVEKSHLDQDAFYCGRIGEYSEAVDFESMKTGLEAVLDEPVKAWQFNDKPIKRVCIVTGGGLSTNDVKEAAVKNCDTYITGEKLIYTVEYARFAGINLLVGSHTYTEIHGVESLASKIAANFNGIELIRLDEGHFE